MDAICGRVQCAAGRQHLGPHHNIDDAGIRAMTKAMASSAKVQLQLYRWAEQYSVGLLQPLRRVRWSAAAEESTSLHDSKRDPGYFLRGLFVRDGPACLVTGTVHSKTHPERLERWKSFTKQEEVEHHKDILEGCHINPLTVTDKPLTQSMLARFSGDSILENDLTEKLNNNIENGLMMETTACRAFESYRFGIECVDHPDSPTPQYRVCLVDENLPKSLSGCDGRVLDFGAYEKDHRPNRDNSSFLPDRRYLQTHLAIAKVLHTSGTDKVIDQILREEEAMREEAMRQKEEEEDYDPETTDEDF